MAFGLSLGASKNNNKGKSTVDLLETTNQAESGTKNSSGSSTSTTNASGSSSGSSSQTTAGSSTTSQTGQTTGTQQQTSSLFSDSVLSGLEGAVSNLFSSVNGGRSVAYDPNFNPTDYIAGGMRAANARAQTAIDESLGGINTATGGTAATNSAAALLQQKLLTETEAGLAGINTQLTGTANEIERANALAKGQLAGADQNFLTNLLQVLKGGSATVSGLESQVNQTSGAQATTGQSTTLEQQQQQQQQQQATTQTLVELLSNLLSGTSHKTGTTTTEESGTKVGGGFSLSL